MGHGNANGAMLQRSVQLLLAPENDHFEVSVHQVLIAGKKGELSLTESDFNHDRIV